MSYFAITIVTLVAILHLYIAWFEMFAWETRGPKVFKNFPKDLFPQTTALAANQGLYNAFLAAGLIWSLFIADDMWQARVAICFLLFVAIAGIYGALTATKRIFFVQTIPSVLGIILILIS